MKRYFNIINYTFLKINRIGSNIEKIFQVLAEQILRKIENGEINPETELGIKKGRETPRSGDNTCLLYTSPSPRDATLSRMPSSA